MSRVAVRTTRREPAAQRRGPELTWPRPSAGPLPPPLPAPPPELRPALDALYDAVVRGLIHAAARNVA